MAFSITTKNNDPKELEVMKVLSDLLVIYAVPLFTDTIVIEKGVIPHSHPVLTLNTRVTDPRNLLQIFVHEQFHWFAKRPNYHECVAHLKTKYIDDGEHNVSGRYPNSYWEHIIVCFNTRRYLESTLLPEDVLWVYSQWQGYPTLEALIMEKRSEIEEDLRKFEMIFKQS